MLAFHPALVLVTSKTKHGYEIAPKCFYCQNGSGASGWAGSLGFGFTVMIFLLDSAPGAAAPKGNGMKMAGNVAVAGTDVTGITCSLKPRTEQRGDS